MVSLETIQASPPRSNSQPSSPRISFSSEFLDESNFISITPNPERDHEQQQRIINNPDFDFLSTNSSNQTMLTADELFFEGKLLPFWQNKMTLKTTEEQQSQEHDTNKEKPTNINTSTTKDNNHNLQQEPRVVPWFVDDDPSPRPPTCTVLWKELLKLKKKRASSTLSPSSSSSSTSSSSSSLGDVASKEERTIKESNNRDKEKQHAKRVKKGLERARSANIRIRPMINVPICSAQVKSTTSALPPLFPLKKGRSVER